ncbi:MAG TPA: hypothetical protein VFI84_03125 [Candidatus Saccharimonadales bacterium]|nr:hypothetical protein [Candidatus Saccharimonadales bacterium]
MKIVVLYRPNSEHGRVVEQFIHDYQNTHGTGKMEVLNLDSREGTATASLYDVMRYPSILALREDGQLLRSWEGEPMPLMDELAAYAYS